MSNKTVELVSEFKYLGFMVKDDLSNASDIQRAMRKFYCEFNSVLRKFSFADKYVKLFLFRQYCLQIYGAELWYNNTRALSDLRSFAIGYHKAIKKILGLSTHESNHYACQEARLLTFKHLLNKIRIMALIRLFSFPCNYVRKVKCFLDISSIFYSEIRGMCINEYDIEDLFENDKDAIESRIIFVQNHEETMR